MQWDGMALPIGPRDHQAFLAVGERFGYPDLVEDGYLHVVPDAPWVQLADRGSRPGISPSRTAP
ncbi:hypothetical protein [Streptomyces sp. NPDC001980]|uniref:hypothetical protein n=1 Tax=Streptomyces sp. NPDC001980 TaxID=3157126 RepID=UPI003324482F